MPAPEKMPCEIRLYVSKEMHEHVKDVASDRGFNIAAYVRDLIRQDMDRLQRQVVCRKTDSLIEAIAEKLGVERSGSEGENSAEKEG